MSEMDYSKLAEAIFIGSSAGVFVGLSLWKFTTELIAAVIHWMDRRRER